jgi:hypothetical protein
MKADLMSASSESKFGHKPNPEYLKLRIFLRSLRSDFSEVVVCSRSTGMDSCKVWTRCSVLDTKALKAKDCGRWTVMKWSTFVFVSVLGLPTVDLSVRRVHQRRPNANIVIAWEPTTNPSTRRGNLQGSVATLPQCACNVTFKCKESNVTTTDIAGNVRALRLPRKPSPFFSVSDSVMMPWPAWKKTATFGFLFSPYTSVTYLVACENDESSLMRTLTMETTGNKCCPYFLDLQCNSMGECEYTRPFDNTPGL